MWSPGRAGWLRTPPRRHAAARCRPCRCRSTTCRDAAFGDAGQHRRPHQLGGARARPAHAVRAPSGNGHPGASDGHLSAVGQAPPSPVGLPALIRPAESEPFVADLGRFWAGPRSARGGSKSATPSTRRHGHLIALPASTRSTAAHGQDPAHAAVCADAAPLLRPRPRSDPVKNLAAVTVLGAPPDPPVQTAPLLVERLPTDLPSRQNCETLSICPANAVAARISIAVTFWAMDHPGRSPTQVSAMSRDIHLSAMSRNSTSRPARPSHAEIAS